MFISRFQHFLNMRNIFRLAPPKPSSNPTNAIFLVLLLLLFPFSPFPEFLMPPKEEEEADRIFCPFSGSLSHRCQKRKVFLSGRVYFILLLLPFQRRRRKLHLLSSRFLAETWGKSNKAERGRRRRRRRRRRRVLLEWGWNFLPKPKREKGPLLAPTFGRHVSFENYRELISGLF